MGAMSFDQKLYLLAELNHAYQLCLIVYDLIEESHPVEAVKVKKAMKVLKTEIEYLNSKLYMDWVDGAMPVVQGIHDAVEKLQGEFDKLKDTAGALAKAAEIVAAILEVLKLIAALPI